MSSLLIAARQPLHIVVLLVALLTGVLVTPWMLPLGIGVYVLAVGLASRDASLLADVAAKERRKGLSDPRFLDRINRIEHSRAEVERSLKRAGGAVASRLGQNVLPQTTHLVEQAYTLANKGQAIEQYLARVNPTQIQNQINSIDARIESTTDQYTIKKLESTREALVEKRDSMQALQTYVGRINSQLDNIAANLDTMPAQIMRMRASDVDTTMASSQVTQYLSDLNADMDAFVTMLDTALDRAGPA
jgi:chromosome segregation ATPase